MCHLTGDRAFFEKACSSLRSSAYAYQGPARVLGGRDVETALQNLIDSMRRILSSRASSHPSAELRIEVDSGDLRAASAAIPAAHWLRRHWRSRGLDLAHPAPQKFGGGLQ